MDEAISISEAALGFLNSGGKRLRPKLLRKVFAACGGVGDISRLEEAVESFHKASLIHDDIQDEAMVRYGRPTFWRGYGIPIAIAAGDWLVAHGYALIAESGFPSVPTMLAAAARAHLAMSEGQADELMGRGDYISNSRRKTGEGFALAAVIGALAASADPTPFREWALDYGVLFQIRDDIVDGDGPTDLAELEREWSVRIAKIEERLFS